MRCQRVGKKPENVLINGLNVANKGRNSIICIWRAKMFENSVVQVAFDFIPLINEIFSQNVIF